MVFVIKTSNKKVSFNTSPSNPSKTRWLGTLKQVKQYLRAKEDVLHKANLEDSDMLAITDRIN